MTPEQNGSGAFEWTVKRLPGERTTFETVVPAEKKESAEKEAMTMLGAKKNVKGFRPGAVPEDILREHVTDSERIDMTVRILAPALLRDLQGRDDVKPILQPRIDITAVSPLTVRVTIVGEPQVKIGTLDKKSFAKTDHKVDDKDVDRVIAQFLKEHVVKKPVDRAAKEGDIVVADFYAEDETKKEIENTRFTDYEIEIGSKTLIPGFEEGVIGMKKGDAKQVTLTFPEKYHAEHLRGKPATFFVTAKEIREVTKPTLTAAFIKEKIGAEKTPEEFREEIRKSLIAQEEQMEGERRENAFFEAVAKAVKTEFAPELITEEAQVVLQEFSSRLSKQGLTIEDWIRSAKKSEQDLRGEVEEQAKRRLAVQWGMRALMEKEKIEASAEDVEEAKRHAVDHAPAERKAEVEAMFAEGSPERRRLEWDAKIRALLRKYLGE